MPAKTPPFSSNRQAALEALKARFPFGNETISADGWIRYEGAGEAAGYTVQRPDSGTPWTLTDADDCVVAKGLPNIMAARQVLAARIPEASTPVAPAPVAPATEKPAPQPAPPVRDAFVALQADLASRFVERESIIRSILGAILVGEHVCLLGDPGTAKSALARAIAAAFDGRYFERLLTKTSTPDELFGPVDLAALKDGRYSRRTVGKMPEAEFAFVDETFKGSAAILNSLLTLMNERIFHNDGAPTVCPLVTVFGASNEMPESKDLDALWDRFLVRHEVPAISRDEAMRRMLLAPEPIGQVQLSLDVLRRAQAEVAAVGVSAEAVDALISIRNSLRSEKVLVSDRRVKKALRLARAHAWMDGDTEVAPEHLSHVADALWVEPRQRSKVVKIVGQFSSGAALEAAEIVRAAEEFIEAAGRVGGAAGVASFAKAVATIDEMAAKLLAIRTSKRTESAVTAAKERLVALRAHATARASKLAGL